MTEAHIGVVGMAVMGKNLALNIESRGYTVAVFNRTTSKAKAVVDENSDKVAEWTSGADEVDGDQITIGYVAWDSEIASTNVIGQVLQDMGYDVTLSQVEAGPMWAGVAEGSLDAHIAGWLPLTHADYASQFEGQFEDLGSNLEGTKIGLVVPSYMDISSIEDLKE